MFKTITLAKAISLADNIYVLVWIEDGCGASEVRISKKAARILMKDFLKVKCFEEEEIWENRIGGIIAEYHYGRKELILGR